MPGPVVLGLVENCFISRLGLLFSSLAKYLDGGNLANSWSFTKFAKFQISFHMVTCDCSIRISYMTVVLEYLEPINGCAASYS